MTRRLLFIICFSLCSLYSFAQIYGHYYNCYELKKRSVKMKFLVAKGGRFADSSSLVDIGDCLNEKQRRNVQLWIHISDVEYLKLPENPAKPTNANHLGKVLPNDVIDSINLRIVYQGEPVAYTVRNGKGKWPFSSLDEFRDRYNARDTLFQDAAIWANSLVVVTNELVLPDEKDVSAKFTIWFRDGKVIRKKL